MRNWFPFTDYDFFGYLACGFTALFVLDFGLNDGAIMLRDKWTVVEVVIAIALAYCTGQIMATPSSILLEHVLARRILPPPVAVLIGAAKLNWFTGFIGKWLIGRYYEPLPEQTRKKLLERCGIQGEPSLKDSEAAFQQAFRGARSNADAQARMDDFRNQYGFNRNMAFVGMLATFLFAFQLERAVDGDWELWTGLAALLGFGMLVRFLKFYAAFAAEVLRAFAYSAD